MTILDFAQEDEIRYFWPVQPYSLYRVVPVTLEKGERPFKEERRRKP